MHKAYARAIFPSQGLWKWSAWPASCPAFLLMNINSHLWRTKLWKTLKMYPKKENISSHLTKTITKGSNTTNNETIHNTMISTALRCCNTYLHHNLGQWIRRPTIGCTGCTIDAFDELWGYCDLWLIGTFVCRKFWNMATAIPVCFNRIHTHSIRYLTLNMVYGSYFIRIKMSFKIGHFF